MANLEDITETIAKIIENSNNNDPAETKNREHDYSDEIKSPLSQLKTLYKNHPELSYSIVHFLYHASNRSQNNSVETNLKACYYYCLTMKVKQLLKTLNDLKPDGNEIKRDNPFECKITKV